MKGDKKSHRIFEQGPESRTHSGQPILVALQITKRLGLRKACQENA